MGEPPEITPGVRVEYSNGATRIEGVVEQVGFECNHHDDELVRCGAFADEPVCPHGHKGSMKPAAMWVSDDGHSGTLTYEVRDG